MKMSMFGAILSACLLFNVSASKTPDPPADKQVVKVHEALKRVVDRLEKGGSLKDPHGYTVSGSRGKDHWRFRFTFDPPYPGGFFVAYAYDRGVVEISPGE